MLLQLIHASPFFGTARTGRQWGFGAWRSTRLWGGSARLPRGSTISSFCSRVQSFLLLSDSNAASAFIGLSYAPG